MLELFKQEKEDIKYLKKMIDTQQFINKFVTQELNNKGNKITDLEEEINKLKLELFNLKYPNGKLEIITRDRGDLGYSYEIVFKNNFNKEIYLMNILPIIKLDYAINNKTILIRFNKDNSTIRRFEMDFYKQVAVEVEYNQFDIKTFEFVDVER